MNVEHPLKVLLREEINTHQEVVAELDAVEGLDQKSKDHILERTMNAYNHHQRLIELENA